MTGEGEKVAGGGEREKEGEGNLSSLEGKWEFAAIVISSQAM